MTSDVMFIGGRSGTGKTSIGLEIHAQLSAAGVIHCLIEGDFLDMAYPTPWHHNRPSPVAWCRSSLDRVILRGAV